ncbi:MAG: lipid A biosynthesis acyltransferase [Gammaproteobacteria bacterium]|nr:lipid A biosynthesis acyltransferase [Gammaproteobacteria bacterium]
MIKKKNYLLFLNPLYWPIWFILSLFWLITRLPHHWQIKSGTFLGKLLYLFPSQLKKITEINIKLCFPHYTHEQQVEFVKKSFISMGIGLIETAMAWWLPEKKLNCLYTIKGLEHAEQAFAKNKGIILIGPHFTCLELVGRLIGLKYTFGVMYRPHKKPIISFLHNQFRRFAVYIPRNKIRQLFSALRNNTAIWYAYDIDGGPKHSVFAPFFGIPTASMTAITRIIRLSGAAIVPISFHRRDNDFGYDLTLLPALENFPSDDPVADATRLNTILEKAILEKPEQYVWQYKRFKTRPPGEKRFY